MDKAQKFLWFPLKVFQNNITEPFQLIIPKYAEFLHEMFDIDKSISTSINKVDDYYESDRTSRV